MIIEAIWDSDFGKREPGNDAIFFMAGETCLGYISRDKRVYMACVGAGMGAPVVAVGKDLELRKRAVEKHYSAKPG